MDYSMLLAVHNLDQAVREKVSGKSMYISSEGGEGEGEVNG